MAREHLQASAVVTVTLEIPITGKWGADCTVGQVHSQAVDEALGLIRTSVDGNSGAGKKPTLPKGTRILGDPQVTQVLANR